MTADLAASLPLRPADARKQLIETIAPLGDLPFQHEIVQSPWQPVVDVEGLHQGVKGKIRQVLKTCGEPEVARCLTVTAPSGYGKTHLLGWTRQYLDEQGGGVFIYVPPYKPDSPVVETFILRAVLDSLRHSSPRQTELFRDRVRKFLVDEVYDRKVQRRKNWRHLGLKYGLIRWLWPSWQKVGNRTPEDQLLMLQKALPQRRFLEMAFAKFTALHPFDPTSARPDWDGFVAACLLACGDVSSCHDAERWLAGKEPVAGQPFDEPCQGHEKVRNILFTLNRLVGVPFCLAFDQMDDMYVVFSSRGTKLEDFKKLGLFLTNLSYLPNLCQLFMFQTSVWMSFVSSVPQQALARMTATHGAQDLAPLDDATAKALVRRRMDHFVWTKSVDQGPPDGEPLFPFREDYIPSLRQQADGRLREFLQLVRAAYCERLTIQPPIVLTQIDPPQLFSNDPKPVTITAVNIPATVAVLFGEQKAVQVQCHPEQGRIEALPPKGLTGSVEVHVVAPDGRDAVIALHFLTDPVPRPYAKSLDRQKIRAKRLELKHTQAQVAAAIGYSTSYVGQLENAKNNPPDEVFDKIAAFFGAPLEDFL